MAENAFGRAAEQQPRNAGTATGSRDDHIRLPLLGNFDDLLYRIPFHKILPRWRITSNSKGGGFQKPSPLLTKLIKNDGGRSTSLRSAPQLGINDVNQGNLRAQCFCQISSYIHRVRGNRAPI